MWYCMKACDAIVSICTRYGKVHNIVYCYIFAFCDITIGKRWSGGFLEGGA